MGPDTPGVEGGLSVRCQPVSDTHRWMDGRAGARPSSQPGVGQASIVTFAQTLLERASPRAPFVTRHPSRAGSTASAPG